jgi:hypothetical protein
MWKIEYDVGRCFPNREIRGEAKDKGPEVVFGSWRIDVCTTGKEETRNESSAVKSAANRM